MQVETTALPGVMLLIPVRHGDARGFFAETWNRDRFAAAGIDAQFAQDNHSLSAQANTVRGLHFQAPPRAQGKLVRCGRGALFDVAVDIRRGSPSYGRWVGAELSFDNGHMLWIPPGFAHGFATREPGTEIVYKCTDTYSPDQDGAIAWDSCGVDWGLTGEPILSDKDRSATPLSEFDSPFEWTGA